MNAPDLARLELAKRAFRATEPSETEVQAGVRRARLALRRPRERRRWFSKGLVMVVLAVGGLAYAKPQPLGELVASLMDRGDASNESRSGKGVRRLEPREAESVAALATDAQGVTSRRLEPAGPRPSAPPKKVESAERGDRGLSSASSNLRAAPGGDEQAPRAAATTGAATGTTSVKETAAALAVDSSASEPSLMPDPSTSQSPAGPGRAASVSEWGRVGQALAHGDESRALSVLSQLSESADTRTRDKADLGRAQLFMSHGNREHACDLARSLARRPVDRSIARQARVLLKNCPR